MQLDLFSLLGKVNPREYYIRACQLANVELVDDYLAHDKFTVRPNDNVIIKKLVNALLNKEVDEKYKTVLQYFLSYDSRVFIDGILFSFSQEDAAKFFNIELEIIKLYSTLFFNPCDFTSQLTKVTFYDYIQSDDIHNFFRKCEKFTYDDLEYTFKNKERPKHKTAQILDNVIQRLYNDYESYSKSHDSLIKENPEKGDIARLELSLKIGGAINQLARTQLQYDDVLNKNEQSFMTQWKMILKTKNTDRFKIQNTPQEEADITAQINKLSPVSTDPKTSKDQAPKQ